MKRLDRYIARTLAVHILLTMAVLLALYSLFAFLEELDDIGKGHYGPMKALSFVFLTLPNRLFEILPGSALLGTLLGLGQMASHQEIIAMRAAGMSIARITLAVMNVGLLLLALAFLVGETLAPRTEQYAESMRTIAITGTVALRTRNGFWMREGEDFINVVEILPGPLLRHVHLYQFDRQGRLETMAYAEEASYLRKRWLLKNIHLSRISEAGVNA
ncbi:MAG: LptF/LptG family permease, partial [Gammaproteobacteria bacterium]